LTKETAIEGLQDTTTLTLSVAICPRQSWRLTILPAVNQR